MLPGPYFPFLYVTFCPPFEFKAGGGEGSPKVFLSVYVSTGSKVVNPAILVKLQASIDPTVDLRVDR